MKIAFVGKGGSGKSTITSLFIQYLRNHKRNIVAIDADLNMNLAGLLGVPARDDILLSNPKNAEGLRNHLKGSNPRTQDPTKFLPTTPPGHGSHIMTNFDHPILDDYSQTVPGDTPLNLITVGTYKKEGIGQSCYHSDLFVAENILSHSLPQKNDWIVCDMVAGTDAFAYSLHVQFDAIMLIAEPTPESVEVCKLFMNLAREAHVESIIHIIGNKIEADDDLEFIEEKLGIKPIAYVPSMRALKKLRQTERPIHELDMTHDITEAMKTIENITFETPLDDAKRMDMLIELHKKLYLKPWVNTFYGNVLEQIDPNFTLTTHMKKEAA